MRVSAIVPVKAYSLAKTRLEVHPQQRADLCHVMLEEILSILSDSPYIHEIIAVTQERRAESLCEEMGAAVLRDDGKGVNQAVALADDYLQRRGAAMSLVLPQDIPLLEPSDISFLLKFFTPPTCVMVVPSARLDGTNALLRCPPRVMGTHYDDDSYRNHMRMARESTPNPALVYVPNIMMDVDTASDLDRLLDGNAKPDLRRQMMESLGLREGERLVSRQGTRRV